MFKRRLNSFDEYVNSCVVYEGHSCHDCNRIRYACLYKQLYKKITSCELEPRELIDVQRTIFETVLELQQEEMKCDYFDKEDKIIEFRMLVTVALQIYVVGADPYNIISLNTDLKYDNDLFNIIEIERLFQDAIEVLEEAPSSFIIISDLCLGNMQFGDLIVGDEREIKGIEVKSGEKNKIIGELVLEGNNNPYNKESNKTDWNHFERFKRQWMRLQLIQERVNADGYIDSQKAIVVSRYWDRNYDNYEKVFVRAMQEAEKHLFHEIIVDNCISIITINKAAQQSASKHLAPPCLYLMLKDLIRMPLKRGEKRAFNKFNASNFPDCEIFPYYAVLHDYGAVQPYLWGVTDKQMVFLIEYGIEIMIKINLESLFDYLHQQGFKIYPMKLYPQKGMPVSYLYKYKNKYWSIEHEDYGFEGATAFTIDTIKRISCGMYTSKGLADYLRSLCENVERITKANFGEVANNNEYFNPDLQ